MRQADQAKTGAVVRNKKVAKWRLFCFTAQTLGAKYLKSLSLKAPGASPDYRLQ